MSPNLARIQAGIQLNKKSQNLAKILVILLYLSLKLSLKSAKMQRNHPNFCILNRKSGPSPIWLNIVRGKTETDYLVFNCHHSYRNCWRSLFLHRFSQSSSIFFSCFPGNADWQVTFELKHVGGYACGIPDMDTIVLTGGNTHQYVTRWDCEENIYNFMYQIMQDVTNLCVFVCLFLLLFSGTMLRALSRNSLDCQSLV